MWLLAFSILFESFICVFVLTNLMAAIPRVLLFAYENFVCNSLLYPILVIEADKEQSQSQAASYLADMNRSRKQNMYFQNSYDYDLNDRADPVDQNDQQGRTRMRTPVRQSNDSKK
jgi:hypothetical protein